MKRDAGTPLEPDRPGRARAVRTADGRFAAPWRIDDGERGFAAFLRWQWQRRNQPRSVLPPPHALPLASSQVAHPAAAAGEIRITWIGHATFLLQIGGANVLTDPVWSERVSPVAWAGPRRLVPAALPFDDLPRIDAVLLSHDHFDHLDRPTVQRLSARFGARITWITPLGYADWLAAQGVHAATELEWWQEQRVGAGAGVRVTALPAQHWTQRSPRSRNARLWCSYALQAGDGARVYFGGDSGWFDGYSEIGRACGPFDALLLPIGAYAPRWFMKPFHLDPAQAADAWQALGARGAFVPMHWGTFLLSDEPALEPPVLLRETWRERGLPDEHLRVLHHGQTLILHTGEEAA